MPEMPTMTEFKAMPIERAYSLLHDFAGATSNEKDAHANALVRLAETEEEAIKHRTAMAELRRDLETAKQDLKDQDAVFTENMVERETSLKAATGRIDELESQVANMDAHPDVIAAKREAAIAQVEADTEAVAKRRTELGLA